MTVLDLGYKHEFRFMEKDFQIIRALVHQKTAIVLHDHKKNMVYSRLANRLRKLGIRDFKSYIQYVQSIEGEDEIHNLVNAITTNLTSFFREDHHFDHLQQVVVPELTEIQRSNPDHRIRIWSAGCSSGEEAYSIAMSLLIRRPILIDGNCKILATDLATNMLETGRLGQYNAATLSSIPDDIATKYVSRSENGKIQMATTLKKMISFKKLNLIDPWPMKGPFDAIFCRNVMIYFDQETKRKLIDKLVAMLRPGGWLYVGHSESLLGYDGPLELFGRTTYRKDV